MQGGVPSLSYKLWINWRSSFTAAGSRPLRSTGSSTFVRQISCWNGCASTCRGAIRESERTVADRDRILAEAKAEADQIVEDARRRVMQALNERSLLEQARYESQRIVDQGHTDARRRVEEADRYTIGVLHSLREELRALIHQVDSGLTVMEGQTGGGRTGACTAAGPDRAFNAGEAVAAEDAAGSVEAVDGDD